MNSAENPDLKLKNLEGRSSPERRDALRKPKTRKVNQRLENPPVFRPRERHYQILEWLLSYRILTQPQFERLLGLSRGSVQPILRLMYDHQWLDRVMRPVVPGTGDNAPVIYKLGKHGLFELQKRGHTDFSGVPGNKLGRYWIDHALDLNTFAITLHLACRQHGYVIEEWLDERRLKVPGSYDRVELDNERELTAVIADGYFKIRTPSGLYFRFWVEMDEGSESQSVIQRKVGAWTAYYKSGAMQARWGGHGRILFVSPYARRLSNLLATAERVDGIGRRFWFGLLSDFTPANMLFEAIWQVAQDRQSLEGGFPASLFDRQGM
jgi:hypothetical protein